MMTWSGRVALVLMLVLAASVASAQSDPDPSAPSGAPPAAEPPPPAPPPSESESPTGIRVRSLEQRVQALKEQAWRVKARVGMLKETVLGGGIGARVTITHRNKMGGSFFMDQLVYALDGQQIFVKSDEETGKLNDIKDLEILSGPIAPGNHTLSVKVVYRGNGYGVFAYLKQYKFTVRSSHTFTASEGKLTQVDVVGYEQGGITTQLKDRPAVDFKENVVNERAVGAATAK